MKTAEELFPQPFYYYFMTEEESIIKGCKKGRESSFKELYELYKGYCYTICVRYGLEDSSIKDCLQEVFSAAFMDIKKFDPKKAGFKTWLTSITINKILMHKRKQVPYSYDIDGIVQHEEATSNINSAESDLDFKKLMNTIQMMPEKYKMVFNLSIIDGYQHREISEMLGISVPASRVLLHRGREWAMNKIKEVYADNSNNLIK